MPRRLVECPKQRCVELKGARQVAHGEAESLKRQEELILEEERRGEEQSARAAAKAEADRLRKARKKEKRKV